MLSVWNPFAPITSKNVKSDRSMTSKDYFDRLFESTFNEFFADLYPYNLGIDTIEQEDGTLQAHIDVPGIKEENLLVELTDNILTIKGERKNKGHHYSLNKSLYIPEKYDAETLNAELNDGVLSITLKSKPKEEKTAKRIEVKSHKSLPEKSENK
jgi:HSP20 family protein